MDRALEGRRHQGVVASAPTLLPFSPYHPEPGLSQRPVMILSLLKLLTDVSKTITTTLTIWNNLTVR